MPKTILNTYRLTKYYNTVKAVENLNLEIKQGEVFGILGPNGSGKTTTLSMLMGIISPSGGTFKWFENQDLFTAKKHIGSLVEKPNFYPYLTADKNLKIVCDIKQIGYNEIERVLDIVELTERRFSKFYTYSFGMKQRMALAALLLGDPQVLVLDEPTNGLDPEGIAKIRKIIINEAAKGKTILLASHMLDEVEKVCSHIAILKKGRLIASGKVIDLLSDSSTVFISCDRLNDLYNLLVKSGFGEDIKLLDNEISLVLPDGVTTADLNKTAWDNGFVLNKINKITKTLEDQFLEFINK